MEAEDWHQAPSPSPPRVQVTSPIEPLLIRLLKGHIDDADLSTKIARLYEARDPGHTRAAATV
jgi:hypothetical protein